MHVKGVKTASYYKSGHLVSMVKPPAVALSTSWLKNSCRGGGWRLSRAWWGKVSWILRATQWLACIMHSATVSWTSRG